MELSGTNDAQGDSLDIVTTKKGMAGQTNMFVKLKLCDNEIEAELLHFGDDVE
eukprot:CAMPEP_0117026906 /NCGR_PEP_ID=MMETSP0472-20121206/19730_1 /TAXON_ID=693140 ORGANISM="Tiarina fusus, Strain LIS" /NCGR_SAMPLE_ID=MMETSP0472 /ASSEMBLY_ACC=CAM_ASM_000603 /LENGTH=52 /DNA_ID=CAMNT_0004734031 /DNA_START=335 /DNA_END=493 /DNA_ORIENTATION=-